ncbi:putative basic leucine zipper 4-like [Cocos nucifera]|nr:putative basic leucine zipper 4-like [Cocos nucifera]
MRKQRHLEDLRTQTGQLRSENQALADRLVDVVHRCLLFRRDNDRLRAESTALSHRLSALRHLLVVRQLRLLSSPLPPAPVAARGGFASAYEQTLASLIA